MPPPLGRSRLLTLLAALSVALVGAVPPSSAAPPAAAPAVNAAVAAPERIPWESCGEDLPDFQCASVTVPLDYDRPRGATTEIAVVRYPAQRPGRRVGSVFVNPGGPGGSGVEMVVGGFGPFLGEQLGGRFDVVGFDPRGVGASDPLHCFGSEEALGEFLAATPVFPYLARQRRPYFEHWTSLWSRCAAQREAVLRHMSTADVARDLDRLRALAGDRRLTYLGFSYGSYLGSTYAHLFPRRVRALVIDGVLDPRLWSGGRQITVDAPAGAEEWREFLRLCKQARAKCAFWNQTGPGRRWDRLGDELRRNPVRLGGTEYTYDLLVADAMSAMYAPEVWGGPAGYAAFLDQVADAALGDDRAAARAGRLRPQLLAQLTADEADYPNGFEAYYGNQCADTEYPSSLRAFSKGADRARRASRFGPYWWWGNTPCATWPTAPDRYAGPWSTDTSAPVLVVGNSFDAVTGLAGAQGATEVLRGSRLLTYAGWGHTAYGRSDCVRAHVDDYLVRGALPPPRTVCPANPNPFLEQPAPGASARTLLGLPAPWGLR